MILHSYLRWGSKEQPGHTTCDRGVGLVGSWARLCSASNSDSPLNYYESLSEKTGRRDGETMGIICNTEQKNG